MQEGKPGGSPHLGAITVLGPPVPRNPWSRFFLAGKAAAACALALFFDALTGNPDHVTSTFVAILSISPVVLMGLRRSAEQVVGSLIGGLCGTAAGLLGLDFRIGIPLAVGAAILVCFAVGFDRGYLVAAFSAMFVQAVPRGEPLETFEVRLLAVATAAVAAFLVNTLVSSVAYRSIFRRRLRYAEASVSKLLVAAAEHGPTAVRPGFALLGELEEQLQAARDELHWRRSRATASWLSGISYRTAVLRRLLHHVLDLSYLLEEEGLPPDGAQAWLRWLVHSGGSEPEVPTTLEETARRIRLIGRTLRVDAVSATPAPAR
ncbi:MAG: aromatic acid exporter family protein [Acidobacteriota bacterium]